MCPRVFTLVLCMCPRRVHVRAPFVSTYVHRMLSRTCTRMCPVGMAALLKLLSSWCQPCCRLIFGRVALDEYMCVMSGRLGYVPCLIRGTVLLVELYDDVQV